MRIISKIDVGSAFRVGAIVYAIFFTIFGLISILLQILILAPLMNSVTRSAFSGSTNASLLAGGGLALVCGYVIGIAVAAIAGGISSAILAWAYNLAARWVGGVKIRLDSDGADLLDDIGRDVDMKRKRGEL